MQLIISQIAHNSCQNKYVHISRSSSTNIKANFTWDAQHSNKTISWLLSFALCKHDPMCLDKGWENKLRSHRNPFIVYFNFSSDACALSSARGTPYVFTFCVWILFSPNSKHCKRDFIIFSFCVGMCVVGSFIRIIIIIASLRYTDGWVTRDVIYFIETTAKLLRELIWKSTAHIALLHRVRYPIPCT